MSTTRRQSGRLAKQRESIANAKLVATNDTDSEDEHSASEASEYGEQDRPSKRQKLVKSAPAKRTKKSSKSADKTHDLTSMPLDVLFEALIALARTNHIVREHLLSKGASGVWRTSRENADGPDCPEDLSEQQWVHLLYGEAWCKSCDAKNIQRVDFGLRRRACTSCLKSNLVVTSSFKRRFPDLDPSILELLPYTNIGGSAHGHASRSKFYWRADIEEMEQTLAVYERDIMMRKVDARKRLEEFKDKRIALVKSIAEHSQLCINWSSESAERRRADGDTKIAERYEAIKAKFLELGYAAADIASIKYYVRQPTALTDRIWKKIRPELEHTIVDERDRRLKQERAARIKTRIAFVQDAYKATKKSMVPTQWRHLPGLFEVVQSPAFQQVINAPDDVDVGAAHFADAVNSLPDFLVEWTVARKKHLNRLMDIALESESGTTGSPTSLPDIGRLNLATSVFKCQQDYCRGYGSNPSTYNPCIIGWDAAGAHHCDHKYTFYWPGRGIDLVETVLHFSKQGSVAAASLVALAGLGAEHATCEEMDARGLLFRCNICTPRKIPGNQVAYDVFTWRNASVMADIHCSGSGADQATR
ncbi:hypothetical protein FB45DRAFT_473064 [Roridomyces roridus]|uniref:Uncharacterized protein n=1 Tax=Roridomyces roridus TaxID=1738132 RepID=A0AAD7BZ43_9AGAR|nr:hypothetical protein FB45DRAFT_473064 [Roridomyces roridus]